MTAQMTLDEALAQAISHHHAGRLPEAEAFYRAILQAVPNHPDANHNLGVIAIQGGQAASALPHFKAALDADPGHQQYRASYIEALIQAGRPRDARQILEEGRLLGLNGPAIDDLKRRLEMTALLAIVERGQEAEAAARSFVEKFPQEGFGWKVLGVALSRDGRNEEALLSLDQAAELSPTDAEIRNFTGLAHKALGHSSEAEKSFRAALELRPDYPEACNNLGLALQDLGQSSKAESAFRKSIEISPEFALAHNNLGLVLKEMGRLTEAESAFKRATAIDPALSWAHCNLGTTLREKGRLKEAENAFRRAIETNPDFAEAHANFGAILLEEGRLAEAAESCRRSLAIEPDNPEALGNLGVSLCRLGDLAAGISMLRKALEIDPRLSSVHSSLIFFIDLSPNYDTATQQAERIKWAALHADLLFVERKFRNQPDPDRILRIGYVSADFNDHSAANGFSSLLGKFDRTHFAVYAYSNSPKKDHVTRSLQKGVTGWREIYGLSDPEAAELIVKDEIDILVDLSGHTAGNRLKLFAGKPAPIQVSAMGYPTGTGMKAMDALLVDEIVVPPEEKHLYAEEIRYLPCVIDYSAKRDFPDVNELPALSGGKITFGSFNRLVKISDETFALWAQLLKALPKSKLILKAGELDDETVRERVLSHFAGMEERITLLGKTSWLEHVKAYNRVDISLDPFPHGGGVTTIESIMMGAPVLTLRYPTFAGRASASILSTLELKDWIAESEEDYIRIAREKSRNLEDLSGLRKSLRGRFQTSLLGKPDYYVREAEKQYRALWREWCAKEAWPK